MKTREALKVLVGSIAVYGVVAACSSAGSPPVPAAQADMSVGGSRLKANYLAGSDGSQTFLSTFHDTQRNEDCAFTTAADGTIRCMPIAYSDPAVMSTYSVYYSDATCTTPIVAVSTCAGNTAPKYVSIGGGPPGTKTGPALYSLGSVTTIGTAYQLAYGGPPAAPPTDSCTGMIVGKNPSCVAVPSMNVDAGMSSDDAGLPGAAILPMPTMPTWSSIVATSTIYALKEVPASDLVEATKKTQP